MTRSQKALERGPVEAALTHTGGNITGAGRMLGASERQVRFAIGKYGIDIRPYREAGPRPLEEGARITEHVIEVEREVDPAEMVALETKVRRLQDQSTRRERDWKEMTRQADLAQRLSDTITPHMERLQLPAVKAPKLERGDRSSITLQQVLSDLHWGKEFTAPMIGGLNAFNPNIAARRMQHVVDVIGEWREDFLRQGRPVERLVLPIIGDMFNGELHPEDEDNYAPILVQGTDCSLVVAQMIAELAHWFPRIDIIAPAGDNHTRLTKKSATSAKAFGTTVNTMFIQNISLLLRGIKHVHVHMDISHQTFYRIYDETWGACHGNMLKGGGGQLGIPAYGMLRHHNGAIAERVLLAKRATKELRLNDTMTTEERLEAMFDLLEGIVDHNLIGHFHTRQILEFTTGDVRLSPSAMGTDPYARDALRKPGGGARQIAQAIHPKHGIIGDYVTNLDQFRDPECTSRYHWGVMDGGVADAAVLMDEWEARQG